jgi:hypothetical protein
LLAQRFLGPWLLAQRLRRGLSPQRKDFRALGHDSSVRTSSGKRAWISLPAELRFWAAERWCGQDQAGGGDDAVQAAGADAGVPASAATI